MRQGRPMRRQSEKARARQARWDAITREKIERGETCVDAHLSRCAGPLDGHHDRKRSLGGRWDEENHVLVCRKHHDRREGSPWHDETAGAECRHGLTEATCAICQGQPRDRVAELIDEMATSCTAEGCGAEIVWAITDNERYMPVDVDPPEDGSGNVELWIDEQGRLRATVYGRLGPRNLHSTHFETCERAGEFRRRASRHAASGRRP